MKNLILILILGMVLLLGCSGDVEEVDSKPEKKPIVVDAGLEAKHRELEQRYNDLKERHNELQDQFNSMAGKQGVLEAENLALKAQYEYVGTTFEAIINEMQKATNTRIKQYEVINEQYKELMGKYTREHARMERQAEAIRKVDKRESPELRKKVTKDEWEKFIKVWGVWKKLYLD